MPQGANHRPCACPVHLLGRLPPTVLSSIRVTLPPGGIRAAPASVAVIPGCHVGTLRKFILAASKDEHPIQIACQGQPKAWWGTYVLVSRLGDPLGSFLVHLSVTHCCRFYLLFPVLLRLLSLGFDNVCQTDWIASWATCWHEKVKEVRKVRVDGARREDLSWRDADLLVQRPTYI